MRTTGTPNTLLAVGLAEKSKLPSVYRGGTSAAAPPPADPVLPAEQNLESKSPRDQAGFIEAARSCANCEYWQHGTGECTKVEGIMDPNDRCEVYFTPVPRSGQSALLTHDESLEMPPAVGGENVA